MEAGEGELIARVTRRCLTDDLGLPAESVDRTIDELAGANVVVAALRDRRAEMGSAGQEPIRSLLPEVVAFSLHVGRRRGATWHHREAGAIWLLAVGYHREGHVDDAYTYFARLEAAGRLLPDRDDMLAFVRSQAPTLARSLLNDVPAIVGTAREHPGVIHSGTIGSRIRVRVVCEATVAFDLAGHELRDEPVRGPARVWGTTCARDETIAWRCPGRHHSRWVWRWRAAHSRSSQ